MFDLHTLRNNFVYDDKCGPLAFGGPQKQVFRASNIVTDYHTAPTTQLSQLVHFSTTRGTALLHRLYVTTKDYSLCKYFQNVTHIY